MLGQITFHKCCSKLQKSLAADNILRLCAYLSVCVCNRRATISAPTLSNITHEANEHKAEGESYVSCLLTTACRPCAPLRAWKEGSRRRQLLLISSPSGHTCRRPNYITCKQSGVIGQRLQEATYQLRKSLERTQSHGNFSNDKSQTCIQ